MCNDGTGVEVIPDAALDPVLSGTYRTSRRDLLRAGGAVALAAATTPMWMPHSAWGASPRTLTGLNPVRNAMHVHAVWSEGPGSWESQFAQAAAIGTDVLWLTDHDFRALAYQYITSLSGVAMEQSTSGSLTQQTTTNNAGVVRVLAESASTSAASVASAVPVHPTAFNQMRTSIAGQTLTVKFPACRIDSGGMYEVIVQLSNHPAYGTRKAGQFEVHYRFGNFAAGRSVDSTGIVGIVTNPTPAAGSTFTLNPTADVAALWPDMLAIDNSLFLLTLKSTSPAKGKVVDVSATVAFARSQNNSSSLIANQQTIVNTYGPRYPKMNAYPTVEISRLDPHIIPFGVPQFWPDQNTITAQNHDTAYDAIADSVHSQGGLVSYNHAFGAQDGPLLSPAQQAANRRTLFAAMMADKRLRTDILEVGYTLRGSVNTQTHIDLWDTFSRQAIFITGNGVNDDHSGMGWPALTNGFATGIWANSPSQADLVSALASGRAYTHHAGKWPNGQLDINVGNRIPMGKVGVSTLTSRSLTIFAANLPANSVVDIYQGPVDFTGNDPGTTLIKSIPQATFGPSATASMTINTTNPTFVRAQVRNSVGAIIGISNPIWTLKHAPPGGVPAARVP